jgi:hypothetical protein
MVSVKQIIIEVNGRKCENANADQNFLFDRKKAQYLTQEQDVQISNKKAED